MNYKRTLFFETVASIHFREWGTLTATLQSRQWIYMDNMIVSMWKKEIIYNIDIKWTAYCFSISEKHQQNSIDWKKIHLLRTLEKNERRCLIKKF